MIHDHIIITQLMAKYMDIIFIDFPFTHKYTNKHYKFGGEKYNYNATYVYNINSSFV